MRKLKRDRRSYSANKNRLAARHNRQWPSGRTIAIDFVLGFGLAVAVTIAVLPRTDGNCSIGDVLVVGILMGGFSALFGRRFWRFMGWLYSRRGIGFKRLSEEQKN